jgi:hypothetical protein
MRLFLFLFLVICSLRLNAQTEYVYKNSEFGIEVTFPSEPKVILSDSKFSARVMATYSIASIGLGYSLSVQNSTYMMDMVETLKSSGYDVRITDNYKVNDYVVTEIDMVYGGIGTRQKIIKAGKLTITLSAGGNTCSDKDVFPFFNSFKIKGKSILSPNMDNSKYTAYNIDYSAGGKTDTVKQIVYVSMGKKTYQFEKFSDVDKNIPLNTSENPYRFALIIGNEDYTSSQADLKSEMNVEFACNDASAFKDYCINTLSIPEKNITFLLDATSGQINQNINKLKQLSKVSNGKAQLIFYYAGHGLPDEVTKEPYLIPVDVNGTNITSGVKLKDLYESLTAYPAERVTVFLDACFSGGGRNAGLLATRGVKIVPKAEVMNGNIVVYSSSSGDESSLPYPDKKHGLFTYYLLRKLQETRGDVTYDDLSAFLREKVSLESLLTNSKEQNPVVSSGQDAGSEWKSWKIR